MSCSQLDSSTRMEVLKLLMQVAHADLHLHPAEVTRIRAIAAGLSLTPAEWAQLEVWLSGTVPLPAPDMGLLTQHRSAVLHACAHLAQADGVYTADEHGILNQIVTMLRQV